jgi:hypothetical protein
MEPDEIQKLYQTSVTTTPDNFYKIVSWSDNTGVRHNSYIRPDGKLDLSSVSTRDLLNECYRRRAIEKFAVSRSVDSYMLQQHPDSMDYVMRNIARDVWDQVVANKKFYEDALIVKQTRMQSVMSTDFEAEIYICKHPTKVKR